MFLSLVTKVAFLAWATPAAKLAGLNKNVPQLPAVCEHKDMVHQKQFSLRTAGQGDMHDITPQVAAAVAASSIKTGTVNVFNIGSTAAIGTIEFEPGLERDLPAILNKLIPPSRNYGHEQAWHDGNGHSHLQATLLGPSLTVPIAKANWCSAHGSKSSISSAMCADANAR